MNQPAGDPEFPIHAYLRDRLRDTFGNNLTRAGEAFDASPSMVSKWIAEVRPTVPSPASCRKIADGLGVDRDYVLSLAGHRDGAAIEDETDNPRLDPRLSAFLKKVEAGWLAADELLRDVGERTTLTVFRVEDTRKLPPARRRVTKQPGEFGNSNPSGVAGFPSHGGHFLVRESRSRMVSSLAPAG